MAYLRLFTVLALFGALLNLRAESPPLSDKDREKLLFDGRTLDGWEGNLKLWRVANGGIAGGSLTEEVKENDFIASRKSYGNFILRAKMKLTGTGFVNSGIQIRSTRVPGSSEMCGYQCDFGDPTWWGCIYDESRRNKVMAQSDMKTLDPVLKRGDWNEYVIRADGARITTWINGVMGVDYMEQDATIAREGLIGFQVHGGGKALIEVKDVTIIELPATPKRTGAAAPGESIKSPVPAEAEQASFTVPPGFEIELVATEDEARGFGKFVAVNFDQKGRLWTMTALEYPVDANENPAAADALYMSKARDKVLVYDVEDRGTNGAPPRYAKEPKVFTDGLAIPLGILPYKDGCYVQHGHDLAIFRDTDADGKADKREVVLTGFGVQDSHLFPHQFTRAPGGWMWMAQGAFNYGKVVGPEGKAVQFDQTRMARFRPDGSAFDITSNGPCNIWGLAMNGEGETFIQEANDFGYAIMPFHEYGNYPGCSNSQWKSYAPEFPGTPSIPMGGTGLSGLALTDAAGAYPLEWSDVMLVANPIIRKVQAIKMHRDGGGWKLEMLPDFVCSADEWFRPVAMTLGPDGCVYIVDWYNKIISHNEVPRNHPERDKKRGRIWRVRHKEQKCPPMPDFTVMPEKEIVSHLGGPSVARSHLAWQALIDRGAKDVRRDLEAICMEASQPAARRIQALWVLEATARLSPALIDTLAKDPQRNVRREIVRAVSNMDTANDEVMRISHLSEDADPQVRQQVIRTAAAFLNHTRNIELLLTFARPSLAEPTAPSTNHGRAIKVGVAYEREFERYLVRMFLERHPQAVAAFLDSTDAAVFPPENLMVACLSLPAKDSAVRVARLIGALGRAPSDEEMLRLAESPDAPEVKAALVMLLGKPEGLQSLLRQKTRFDARALAPLIEIEAKKMLESHTDLALKLISAFELKALEPDLAILAISGTGNRAALLRTLRELGSTRSDVFLSHVKSPDPVIGNEAIAGLANIPDKLIPLWNDLTLGQRSGAMEKLTMSKAGALAVISAIQTKALPQEDLDGPAVEKMAAVLGEHDPSLNALMDQMEGRFRPVMLLDGKDESWIDEPITLEGPFTVECWVRLASGIGNEDSILGSREGADFNFFGAQFRVYVPEAGDVAISKKPITAEIWTHLAVTRDEQGFFKIYQNGELDQTESKPVTRVLKDLRIGRSNPPKGTAGALSEFRIWNKCRTLLEIRGNFDRTFPDALPCGLVMQKSGSDWHKLHGAARVMKTTDFPNVMSPAEAAAVDLKYAKFHALAEKLGDVAQGKLMATICMGCHTVNGTGGMIGPNLSGAGAMGIDGLLRNLLVPNAAMEPGYRVYRLEMVDGTLQEGFLVSEDEKAIVFRQVGVEDSRIPRDRIRRGQYLKRSLMPEGLLDAFSDEQVSHLFSYLKTLR